MANTTGNGSRPEHDQAAREHRTNDRKDTTMSIFHTRPTVRTLVAPFAAALLVSVALSGCTLRVAEPQSNNQGAHVNTGENENNDGAADADPYDDDIDVEEGGDSDDIDVVTLDCDDLEPGDTLYIDSSYDWDVVTVNGDCGDVSISASNASITLNELNDMDISGDDNAIVTTSLISVTISGDDNAITWEHGSPDVYDDGSGNAAAIS